MEEDDTEKHQIHTFWSKRAPLPYRLRAKSRRAEDINQGHTFWSK